MTDMATQFGNAVCESLRELLESKHLFQSVQVNIEKLLKPIPRKTRFPKAGPHLVRMLASSLDANERSRAKFENLIAGVRYSWPWRFACTTSSAEKDRGAQVISLPGIRIPCEHCDAGRPTHRAKVQENEMLSGMSETNGADGKLVQIFALPYQCQNCLAEPVIFFIRRESLKLTLVGRSQFEPIPVPKCIPKAVADHYRDATVAFKTGHCLAAIFYLRTAIEQHMRGVVKPAGRISGEELADQYQKILPPDFPSRFPSFKKLYQELSVGMHEARTDDNLFVASCANVEKHFEAVRLLAR
jgi:hypothetical protein